jgi:3-deoxy-7-phosphoheptulonate synthase
MSGGIKEVILCERGIRTFETYKRTPGFAAYGTEDIIHLPVFVDQGHSTGRSVLCAPFLCGGGRRSDGL